eukprot:4204123-Alexandrium_andersonii.AAC.1
MAFAAGEGAVLAALLGYSRSYFRRPKAKSRSKVVHRLKELWRPNPQRGSSSSDVGADVMLPRYAGIRAHSDIEEIKEKQRCQTKGANGRWAGIGPVLGSLRGGPMSGTLRAGC